MKQPLRVETLQTVGDNLPTPISRSTPIRDPRLVELARWSCGDIGDGWARGNGQTYQATPAQAQVFRCLGALDEALEGGKRELIPLARESGATAYRRTTGAGDFGVEIGLRLGSVNSALHVERIGGQYFLTEHTMMAHTLVLDAGEAFALVEAIIELAKAHKEAREKFGAPPPMKDLMQPHQPLTPEENAVVEKEGQRVSDDIRTRQNASARAEMTRQLADAAKLGLVPTPEEIEARRFKL